MAPRQRRQHRRREGALLLGHNAIWPKGADDPAAAATAAAAQLSADPAQPGVEVPMFRDGLYARADAVIPAPSGGYILRETKASTFPLKKDEITPDAPEEHHLDDLAIQAWVYQASGWRLAGAELNLLDNQWRYPGDRDYSGLFRQFPVAADISGRISEVPNWHTAAQRVLAGTMPTVQTGPQCSKPYDCPYYDHCKTLDTPGPQHPLTLLPGAGGKSLARKLNQHRGHTSHLDPQPSEFTGADAALFCRMQISHRTGQPVLEPGSAAAFAALPTLATTLISRESTCRCRAGSARALTNRSHSSGPAISNAPLESSNTLNSLI